MRLYCINNKPIPGTWNVPSALAAIKEGEEYDGYMVQAIRPGGMVVDAWRIPAIYNGKDVYNINRFIPLPDTTADEMAEEEREAIVNLETVLA